MDMESQTGIAPSMPQKKLHLGCYNRPTVGWYSTDISMQIRLSKVPFDQRTAHKLGLISGSQLADHNAGIWKSVNGLLIGHIRLHKLKCAVDISQSHSSTDANHAVARRDRFSQRSAKKPRSARDQNGFIRHLPLA